ncbi:hypothetical protein KC722_03500, partial [Candidatus Kaiserbacteria bacterium]|nr:hypothetical protein [Candidatus Kaiserbacteria bacterium]
IEFTLLHLDRRDDNALAMTKFLLNEFPLWQNIAWRAAANATSHYQKNLGEWLDQPHAFTFESREAINHLMYFLKNARLTADSECLAPHQRLRLLQRHYQTITLLDMIDYFDSLIERILVGWIGGEEMSRSLAYLHGTERFWDQRIKGKQFFQRLRAFSKSKGVTDWDQLLELMLIILLEMSRLFSESRDEPIELDSVTGEKLDERERLWAYVVEGFCTALVSEMGLDSFKWLDQRGWFKWHNKYTEFPGLKNEIPIFWLENTDIIHPNVWRMMSEHFTRAFGAWYWQSDDNARDSFSTLVEILAGIGGEEEQAFVIYLLYHVKLYSSNNQQLDEYFFLLANSLQRDGAAEVRLAWKRTFGRK